MVKHQHALLGTGVHQLAQYIGTRLQVPVGSTRHWRVPRQSGKEKLGTIVLWLQ